MDVVTTPAWLATDEIFTDVMGHTHQVSRVQHIDAGYYVYVVGQNHPEFYTRHHQITVHVPETKFKPGDMVQARNGRGAVYMVTRIIPANRVSGVRYEFDNGSVDIRKRARSGYHDVAKADRGFRKVT
jgi:hypothetical protein